MIKRLLFCCLLMIGNAYAITIGTYNAPPFSMYEDGENIGMATESVRTLLKKCGIEKYNIINYPLARGLVELQEKLIDIYYPYIIDSAAKDDKYILVGPIARYKIALFVRKDYTQPVTLPAMKHLILGAERGSISDRLLQSQKMNIEQATEPISCLRMVLAERVSACAMGELPGQYSAAINNLATKLRYEDTGSYADMYVVLGASLPKELVEKIHATFAELKEQDYFEDQQQDYEQKFHVFIKSLS